MRDYTSSMDLLDTQVFGLIGVEGFQRLVGAFYRRVRGDDLLAPLYPERTSPVLSSVFAIFSWDDLAGRCVTSNSAAIRALHAHNRFRIDRSARDRWVSLMEAALAETKLHPEAERMLRQFFHDSATFLINRGGDERA